MRRRDRVRARCGFCGLVLLAALVLGGCGDSSTGTWLPGAESGSVTATRARLGGIELLDVLIEHPRASQSYSVGHDARMGLELVNHGPSGDFLLSVETPIARKTQVFADQAPHDGTQQPTALSGLYVAPATATGPTKVRAYVELQELTTPARVAQVYPITFHFRNAGVLHTTVTVDVPQPSVP